MMCSADGDCTSGHCVGSICCATACVDQGAATCGHNGQCLSNGTACAFYNNATPCGGTCVNGQLTPTGTCNGSGTCGSSTAPCMGGFICASGSACKTACAVDADCLSSSNYCMSPGATGTCTGKGVAGAGCTANDQCVSNLCGTMGTGTRCCTATCSTADATCGATDCTATGACNYKDQTTSCGTGMACDSAGNCKLSSGQPCTTGGQCASGTCNIPDGGSGTCT
jgi:hypothetical protein